MLETSRPGTAPRSAKRNADRSAVLSADEMCRKAARPKTGVRLTGRTMYKYPCAKKQQLLSVGNALFRSKADGKKRTAFGINMQISQALRKSKCVNYQFQVRTIVQYQEIIDSNEKNIAKVKENEYNYYETMN